MISLLSIVWVNKEVIIKNVSYNDNQKNMVFTTCI